MSVSKANPLLGFADHNVVHLIPHYKLKLKLHKPQIYSAMRWSEDSITASYCSKRKKMNNFVLKGKWALGCSGTSPLNGKINAPRTTCV